MSPSDRHLAFLSVTWLAYFVIHSLLASLPVKEWVARRWPKAVPAYRLIFNGFAILLLLPPAWLTLSYPGTSLWSWTGIWSWLATAVAGLAVVGFLWSLRYYDAGEFLGLRQLKLGETSPLDQEGFHLSPLHRFVRHPWYSLTLALIWTRDMDAARLLSIVMITLYFLVGSRFEERKLMQYHGEVYARYRERVPSLVPLPWRYLKSAEAQELVARWRCTESIRGQPRV